jgi:hypothetical protein
MRFNLKLKFSSSQLSRSLAFQSIPSEAPSEAPTAAPICYMYELYQGSGGETSQWWLIINLHVNLLITRARTPSQLYFYGKVLNHIIIQQ